MKEENKEIIQDNNIDKSNMKSNHILRNIFIVIVFLGIGIFIGIYGTTKYLDDKKDVDSYTNIEEDDTGLIDITDSSEYSNLIDELYEILDKNTLYYSSLGTSVDTFDNNTKLMLIYNYLVKNEQGSSETLEVLYYGSNYCSNEFVVDSNNTTDGNNTICTVTRFSKTLFTDTSKLLFNYDNLDTSLTFSPVDGKMCIVDGESYVCGNVLNTSLESGSLEAKFNIVKVEKDEENTIYIYDKGYLVDTRSSIVDTNSGYDNYYLHSSDSTDYYYELKSADNLTFVHTFKTLDGTNYYYVSSMVSEDE